MAVVCLALALVVTEVGGDLPRLPDRPGAGGKVTVAGPPPAQRWASAADQQHVVGKPGNTTVPASLRGRYPKVQWKPAPNKASVVTGPTRPVRGFDQATSVPAATQQSAYEKTYDNTDGTQTTEFSTSPVNYRKPDGSWAPIDTQLVPQESGGWRNTADAIGLRLGGSAADPALATVTFDDQHAIAYTMQGAGGGAADAAGSTVTYHGVAPGVDLKLEARPGGLKETIVLASRTAPASAVFPFRLTGLTARLDGGQVLLADEKGKVRGVIPAGTVSDAAGQLGKVGYQLDQLASGPSLRVTVDEAWLRDPQRVFPVQVDPTVQVPVDAAAADSSMYVQGSSSASGSSQLLVGTVDGASSAAYLKFGSLVSKLQYHTIFGAKLWLVNYDSDSCRPRQVTVHPVTGSWSAGTGYSYPGPAVGASLAGKSFAHGYIAFGQSSSACPTTGELLDLGTGGRDLVQRWVNGDQANYGLSLRASSDSLSGKRFAGSDTANPPKLYVTHTPYYATYSIPNPVPNPVVLQNQDGKIKVSVTNKSAAAWSAGDYYLAYRAYNAVTGAAVVQQRSANLTAAVSRGGRVTFDATIKAMAPGKYFLDFSMVKTGGPVFTDYQVPPARLVLEVFDIPPVVQELYPPNGYQAPTLTPQLWARALDIDATPSTSLSFKFEVCDRDSAGSPVSCTNSGYTTATAWTVPSGRLVWSSAYLWRAFVKDATSEVASPYSAVLTAVPQPEITSRMAGSPYSDADQDFDPQVGNYTTEALDASVATAGPQLRLIRTYNSVDPRRDGLFGAGWTSRYDMKLVPDDDGSGNVVITYPDGQVVRFGRNADGSYAAPAGRIATLTLDSTSWRLVDSGATTYQFSLTGRLTKITDGSSRSVVLTYSSTDGKLAKAQVSNSQTNTAGRALTFTWSGSHVVSVSTDAVNGAALTWNYTYSGDLLTKVCSPGGSACTTYEYAAGSHYRSAVLDSRPESYWRLGEPDGTAAAGEVAVNLGKDAGTYKNVTLASTGVLTGTANTAAYFNGTTSYVDLPKGTLKKSRDGAVEIWFKNSLTGTGGPLLGYQDKALGSTSTTGVPILYVGTDGKLRGQFGTGSITPIVSTAAVNDGKWHQAVLSTMATTQTLYLDGAKVADLTGVTIDHSLLTFNQIGAAYASTPASWPAWGSTAQRSYAGTIDEVSYYTHPLGVASVAAHYKAIAQADQLAKVTLPSGKVAGSTVYNTDLDRLKEHTDANGGTWKIGAPAVYGGDTDLRRAVEVLDPADRPSLYEYDAIGGWLLRLGQPLGLVARADDSDSEPSASPSPAPTQTCSTPDATDPTFCTVIPDSSGGPVFVAYDADGVSIRSFSHNEDGSVGTVTDENGDTVTMTYDGRGNVTSTQRCRTAGECHTSYATYPTITSATDPRNDLPVEVRDGRSASTTDNTYRTVYTYSTSGQPLTQTNPDGGLTTNTYTVGAEAAVGGGISPAGLLATTTDARGKVTSYAYYANGDLARVTDPSGLVTSHSYDAIGRETSQTQVSDSFPSGVTTTYTYDGMGRPLTELDAATTDAVTGAAHRQRTTSTYDADGNVTTREVADVSGDDPARVTTYEYDEHNRQTRVTDAEGNETEYGFDSFGNRVSVTDANGNRYDYAYTARNSLAEVRLRDWHSDPAGTPATGTGDYLVLRSYTYDLAGRPVSVTDAMGRRVETVYYRDGLLQKSVLKNFHNPDGSTRDVVLQDNVYDGAGNLTRQVTDNGKVAVQHTYDRVGRVATTVADPGGLSRSTTYTYDAVGNVVRTVLGGNASNVPWATSTSPEAVTYSYDDANNLAQETVSDGTTNQVTTYGYDDRGLVISTVDPRGNDSGADATAFTTTFRYDELGRQVAASGAPVAAESGGGQPATVTPTVTTGYNTFGETVSARDALGQVSTSVVDKLGRAVSVTGPTYLPPGASVAIQPVTLTSYDGNGNTVAVTDPRGNVTRTTYDQLDRAVSVDAPATTNTERAVSSYAYTRTGQPLSEVDPSGARAEATYDDMDRQVTSTQLERQPDAATYTTVAAYDDASNLIKVVSPTGATTTNGYDALGQLVQTTDPNGVAVQLGYDMSGRQVRVTDGTGRSARVTYDLFGQEVADTALKADGTSVSAVTYRYDLAGNVVAAVDPKKVTTSYRYDAGNRLTQQVQPVSATESITTSYGYDAAGDQTRVTDGRGNSTITTFNNLGLPEAQIEPATTALPNAADRTWTSGYDAAGHVVSEVAPGGVRRTSTYDAAGRLQAQAGTGAESDTVARSLRYDLDGRLVEANAASGTNTYSYDDRGNLLGTAGPGGTATFRYDGDGNRTTRTDAAGSATFGYTKARLTSVTDGITGTTQQFGYDVAGQLKTIGYGAGRTRTYTYDDRGLAASDTLTNAGGTTVAAATYRYDDAGQLSSETRTGTVSDGDLSYGYDYAGRLTSQTQSGVTTAYGWDAAGNRTRAGAKTATYDERNQLLSDGDYSYTYSARGTMKTRTSSGLTEQYSFDALDRLTNAAGQTYAYDGLNRVATRNGAVFAYAGLDDEIVGDGTAQYGRGPDDELLATGTSAAKRLSMTDQHGDVVGGFDPADTTLAKLPDTTAYDPFGTVTAKSGTTGAIGFQGDWTDPGTGQVDMGARWYNPGTGGFTSRDSVDTSAGGGNRYAYAGGDPLDRIDPDGHDSCWSWEDCGSDSVVPCDSNIWCSAAQAAQSMSTALLQQANAQSCQAGGRCADSLGASGQYPLYASGPAGRSSRSSSSVSCGSCYRETPYQRAKKVSDAARAQNAYAAKHRPLPVIDAATVPLLNMPHAVSSVPSAPAHTTGTSKDVVSDQRKGTTVIYQAAVAKAGNVVSNVSAAASTTYTYTWTDRVMGLLVLGLELGLGLPPGLGNGDEHPGTKWGGIGAEAGAFAEATGIAEVGRCMKMAINGTGSIGQTAICAVEVGLIALPEVKELEAYARPVVRVAGREAVEAVGAACTATANSFTGDTAVRLADGSTEKISEVRVGEKVKATDPTTGREGSYAVTDVIVGSGEKHLVAITLDDGATVTATDGHPFWVGAEQRWVDAGDLVAGERVGGETIRSVRSWTERTTVYNLTVDTLHTFYVVAGGDDLLVHNIDWAKCGRAAKRWGKAIYEHGLTPTGHGLATAGRYLWRRGVTDIAAATRNPAKGGWENVFDRCLAIPFLYYVGGTAALSIYNRDFTLPPLAAPIIAVPGYCYSNLWRDSRGASLP